MNVLAVRRSAKCRAPWPLLSSAAVRRLGCLWSLRRPAASVHQAPKGEGLREVKSLRMCLPAGGPTLSGVLGACSFMSRSPDSSRFYVFPKTSWRFRSRATLMAAFRLSTIPEGFVSAVLALFTSCCSNPRPPPACNSNYQRNHPWKGTRLVESRATTRAHHPLPALVIPGSPVAPCGCGAPRARGAIDPGRVATGRVGIAVQCSVGSS
jgi:hypothetical protein